MQGARGGGEGAARAGDDAGGKKVDRGIFVCVGAASGICAERGGRGSGQVGHGGGAGQIEFVARTAECGSGGDLRATGGGAFRDVGERSGRIAGVLWIEGAGAEPADSRDVRLDGIDPIFYSGGTGGAGVDDSKGSDGGESGGVQF